MFPRVGWSIFALLPGCYSPSYVDCAVTCASGFGCPSGLTCDTTVNACRAPAMVGQACAGAGRDAGIDAACDWKGLYPASNIDPCSSLIPMAVPAITIDISGTTTFDTDNGKWTTAGTTVDLPGAIVSSLWVIHTTSFIIDQDSIVNLIGKSPLLIIADSTISIAGNLDATASSLAEAADCGMPDGLALSLGGQGGGGGGYAVAGANGGSTGVLGLRPGEMANGDPTLATLRAGCRGGNGGSPATGLLGGLGGAAGGAFGLIAGESITITDRGTLLAGGGGGGGGSNANACDATPCSSGGGGGGTGGSILFEAPMIAIDGALCAAGGGGGEGGVANGATAGSAPNADECHAGQAGSGAADPGGTGGDTITPTGLDGTSSTADSGGGGGGSVGRIYLHARLQPGTGGSAVFLPEPTTQFP